VLRSRIPGSKLSGAPGGLSVSLVGTLPPVKGVSSYTSHLLGALADDPTLRVQFAGFRRIYPKMAYPGGDPEEPGMDTPSFHGVVIRTDLSWRNPFSWVYEGFRLRGEVVHAQWWSYALAPVYATMLGIARLRGKRVLLTVHNVEPHEGGLAKRIFNRAVFRFAHEFVVHSDKNRATLARIIGGDDRITVLPHGVLETPRTGMSRMTAREKLGLPREAAVVLAFGNVRQYKGTDVLLRAFADVVRQQPDAILVIAGNPWLDFTPYQRLIDELGIGANVRLRLEYVPTPEVEAYFVAADVVALPYTHFDAQTGVGTLALPFGRPLVVSDVGGLPELVMERNAIVPPRDAGALAGALLRVLGDAAMRDRMSVDSLTIAGSLGWERIAARTIAVYERLAGAAVPEEQPLAEPAGARRP
jgi:glycosyltransferase involved in cell wall biosynthesis